MVVATIPLLGCSLMGMKTHRSGPPASSRTFGIKLESLRVISARLVTIYREGFISRTGCGAHIVTFSLKASLSSGGVYPNCGHEQRVSTAAHHHYHLRKNGECGN